MIEERFDLENENMYIELVELYTGREYLQDKILCTKYLV